MNHQVSLTAEDNILSKIKFERKAMGLGVPVESYSIDNGIYNYKYLTRELHGKGQGIRHSGVIGNHHNGVAQNSTFLTAVSVIYNLGRFQASNILAKFDNLEKYFYRPRYYPLVNLSYKS